MRKQYQETDRINVGVQWVVFQSLKFAEVIWGWIEAVELRQGMRSWVAGIAQVLEVVLIRMLIILKILKLVWDFCFLIAFPPRVESFRWVLG